MSVTTERLYYSIITGIGDVVKRERERERERKSARGRK